MGQFQSDPGAQATGPALAFGVGSKNLHSLQTDPVPDFPILRRHKWDTIPARPLSSAAVLSIPRIRNFAFGKPR